MPERLEAATFALCGAATRSSWWNTQKDLLRDTRERVASFVPTYRAIKYDPFPSRLSKERRRVQAAHFYS